MIYKIFAGFTFSRTEEILLTILVIAWLLIMVFLAVAALYVILFILSKITKKNLTFERLFLNSRVKRLYPKIIIGATVVLLGLAGYYGLIDN